MVDAGADRQVNSDWSSPLLYALPGNGPLWALGWHGGAQQWFKAEVVALRVRFPRVHVRFLEAANGATHPLALPTPNEAYVHAGMLRERDWD